MNATFQIVRALSRFSGGRLGRRVIATLETRMLARMLARTRECGPQGRALGYLFERYEPGRSPGEIYHDVFSAERFDRGYRSQMAQDLFLDRWLFKGRGPGFFVDVGAFDGELGSNTYYFEKRLGWSGVAFEPNPPAFEALKSRRTCRAVQACAYESDGEISFLSISADDRQQRTESRLHSPNLTSLMLDPNHNAVMLSGIKEHMEHPQRVERARQTWNLNQSVIRVPCRRIDSVLHDAGVRLVDYLSVDVEGAELQVLGGLDFDQLKVNVISIESSPAFPAVYKRLTEAGFEYHGLLFFDEIFVHRECRFTWEG